MVNGFHFDISPLDHSPVIAGPATVALFIPGSSGDDRAVMFTYRKTVIGSVATQNVPTQAVAIPENTIAPVDVILETSTDLVTWIAALPGNYTPAPEKRFFRVRTVLH